MRKKKRKPAEAKDNSEEAKDNSESEKKPKKARIIPDSQLREKVAYRKVFPRRKGKPKSEKAGTKRIISHDATRKKTAVKRVTPRVGRSKSRR